MSPIGTIRNKITSAGAKSAEQLRAAAVRVTARSGRTPYTYEEPQEDVLRMQETVSERLREGESPESVLGSSIYLQKDARPPLFSIFMAVREPDLRLFKATLTSVLAQTYGAYLRQHPAQRSVCQHNSKQPEQQPLHGFPFVAHLHTAFFL